MVILSDTEMWRLREVFTDTCRQWEMGHPGWSVKKLGPYDGCVAAPRPTHNIMATVRTVHLPGGAMLHLQLRGEEGLVSISLVFFPGTSGTPKNIGRSVPGGVSFPLMPLSRHGYKGSLGVTSSWVVSEVTRMLGTLQRNCLRGYSIARSAADNPEDIPRMYARLLHRHAAGRNGLPFSLALYILQYVLQGDSEPLEYWRRELQLEDTTA